MNKKVLMTISIILMIFNEIFAFVMIGRPKKQISRFMYPVYVDRSHVEDVSWLNSDAVAITGDGQEAKVNTAEMNRQVEKEYKHDLMVQRLWFIFPGSGGSYLWGSLTALVVAFFDGILLLYCKKSNKTTAYIVFSALNAVAWPLGIVITYTMMCGPLVR